MRGCYPLDRSTAGLRPTRHAGAFDETLLHQVAKIAADRLMQTIDLFLDFLADEAVAAGPVERRHDFPVEFGAHGEKAPPSLHGGFLHFHRKSFAIRGAAKTRASGSLLHVFLAASHQLSLLPSETLLKRFSLCVRRAGIAGADGR